ncbi:GMC family oxidoreductase [Pseudonocardia alaniniphila]|uniref:GMC family oxidoreductase n=1 Tax=Pseudonocardia alaniniphila TaxID=75291 RepID=A0ABS9TBD0_9PSEU|nr:GMC family oxidoreductase [Pseudonocardia alaniniphila]MCH6165860.1 GMC family oxidoreductase [Pseudonocardia alaniniphila]
MSTSSDYLIVGGGSAGAVLANRLSARGQSVTLIEAGHAYRPNLYPAELANADIVGPNGHDWGYVADTGQLGRRIHAIRAKSLGGSSTVNAAVAIRSRPADFAKWTAAGLEDWTWDEVLPAYRSIENTADGTDELRGRSGALPIRTRRPEELTPSQLAFIDGAAELGYRRVEDFNGAEQDGVAPYPLNVISGRRINTGIAFLDDGVRSRAGLQIVDDTEIVRVLLEDRRAVGVVAADGTEYRAETIVLAAGTYGSPAILMRSGIGPVEHLQDLGIDVLADLPVGDGLQEHPFYYNIYALTPDANSMHPASGAILWTASSSALPGDLDVHISATHLFDPSASPTGGAMVLAVSVTQPESRGRVRLDRQNPQGAPVIAYNLLGTPHDMDRMLEGVRLARRIGTTPAFARVVDRELTPGPEVTDALLEHTVLEQLDVYHHPTSTVAMGPVGKGVVDSHGRVHGIDGLVVADASIMPLAPSAPPNITTMMLADRVAGWLLTDADRLTAAAGQDG